MPRKRRARKDDGIHRVRLSHWRADGQPKARYSSEQDANRATLQYRLDHGVDLGAYTCEFCGGWHLGKP
jgi:hypothetical protein